MNETPNAAQAEYWNETAGPVWAAMQAGLDRQIAPLGRAAMNVLAPAHRERILDIGCGCGQSAWELAERVGADGEVVGVDLSRPMLEVARGRTAEFGAAAPKFREADAQTAELGAGAFDAAFSRFGVMFFSDPPAAFANIGRALKAGGRLAFVCWRSVGDNPMMYAPVAAAASLLPPAEPTDPTAPGPFAFADSARVRSILGEAGFRDVVIAPFDTHIGGADLDGAVAMALRIGPLGAALRADPSLAPKVTVPVREGLARYLTADGVMFPAAVWIVSARV
jgi:SAM-dependent methyltransferase